MAVPLRSKIVMIANVDTPHDDCTDLQNAEETVACQNKTADNKKMVIFNEEGMELKDSSPETAQNEEEGEKDVLSPLPEDWPKIPSIYRRWSCEMTNTMYPCVNKTVGHLELVQKAIENWFKTSGGKCIASSNEENKTAQQSEVSESQQRLFQESDSVFNEVVTLLARLDNDCQETELALEKERERVRKLSQRIHDICLKKLSDIASAVQKEHEKFLNSTMEVNWHLIYYQNIEIFFRKELPKIESYNTSLKEKTEFFRSQIPLVEEKLELEKKEISKLLHSVSESEYVLDRTVERWNATKSSFSKAENKTTSERTLIQEELALVDNQLINERKLLADAQVHYKVSLKKIEDTSLAIKEKSNCIMMLNVKLDNYRSTIETWETNINSLKKQLKAEEKASKHVIQDYNSLKRQLRKVKIDKVLKEKLLTNLQEDKEEILHKLTVDNQGMVAEIDKLWIKVKDLESKHIADVKNLKRIGNEINKVDEQLQVTGEEYDRLSVLHMDLANELNEKNKAAEEKLRELRRLMLELEEKITEEIKTKKEVAEELESIHSEFSLFKQESEMKLEKISSISLEVSSAVSLVEQKVKELRELYENKVKMIDELRQRVKLMPLKWQEKEKEFIDKFGILKSLQQDLLEHKKQLMEKLQYLELHQSENSKALEEIVRTLEKMKAELPDIEDVIHKHNEELKEYQLQLELIKKVDVHLRKVLEDTTNRLGVYEMEHKNLTLHRRFVLREFKHDREESIKLNKSLATRYRILQNQEILLIDMYTEEFEGCLILERAIRDLKQMLGLQHQMYSALTQYFNYLNWYNKSELNHMLSKSSINVFQVAEIHQKITSCLSNMIHYLKANVEDAANKKCANIPQIVHKHKATSTLPKHTCTLAKA